MKCLKRCGNKIILVPYPAQGHVTPMLKLASAFHNLGFNPVLVIPEFIHRSIATQINENDGVSCVSIPDGLDVDTPRDFFNIEEAMENNMPLHLERLVCNYKSSNITAGISCMVVDILASWAIQVANKCGVQVAGFWPAMLTTYQLIHAIPFMLQSGIISETGDPQHGGPICFLPGQPILNTKDLPWLIGTSAARKSRFKFWTKTLERSKTLPWLLVNSFSDELTTHDHMNQQHEHMYNSQRVPNILTIAPLSDHALVSKNLSFWEEDRTCLDWLDTQSPCSVVYVSFGSWVSPIGDDKVKSLALALEATTRPFIWVLGNAWREGLPDGYLERVAKQGRVISWAPQIQVLNHRAVGCYLTHCGWNSTMEAVQCKKRLVCYPIAGDQFVNCAYIVNVWRIGIQINGFGRKDVEVGMKRVMEDFEMDQRLKRINEMITGKEAGSRAMANLTILIDDLQK